ncbi:ABC transporter ATP-binding protein [Sphaerobacter sp.]|uniref:ABC transporter ATP-binding protein n=1 Tax=Sphaerobacter sp. TaxID=2099654 RepID=UPI001D25780B|nr:ABC transporter ATP-binding protein [Sphaerobacter sp.]MBX5443858.1 ABC transporter ATP-binding protein [Sphaerobacter sp.]
MIERIDIDHLTLRYGDVTALDELSLSMVGGKIYGLLGRNGSGKTSLLSVLASFRKPTSGDVRINGQPVFENQAITSQIAFIRESGDTVEDTEKVESAMRYAAYLRPNWDAEYAARLLERFEVSTKARIGSLSRGKRSALGIVLGLAARAPLTIFDETYLGMDAPSRYAFYDELLNDFMEHPRTFIISTHLIEEVSRLFENVVIIDRGRLVVQDDVETLLSRGNAVTGPADVVDQFVNGYGFTVIGTRQLGRTKSAMVYGQLDPEKRAEARAAGLDLEPLALQDLFVHLTEPRGDQS